MVILREVKDLGLGVAMIMVVVVAVPLGSGGAEGVRRDAMADDGHRARVSLEARTAARRLAMAILRAVKDSGLGAAMMTKVMVAVPLGNGRAEAVRRDALAGDSRRTRASMRARTAARTLLMITVTVMMRRDRGGGRWLASPPSFGAAHAEATQAASASKTGDAIANVAAAASRRSAHVKSIAPRPLASDGTVGRLLADDGESETEFRVHADAGTGGGRRRAWQIAGPGTDDADAARLRAALSSRRL